MPAEHLQSAFRAARARRAEYLLLRPENLLTPREYADLYRRLLTEGHPNAVLMARSPVRRGLSGAAALQHFRRRSIAPGAWIYRHPEARRGRSLLVCFTGKGGRMGVAITGFLQAVAAERFDVLVLRDRAETHYRAGLSPGDTGFDDIVALVAALTRRLGHGHVTAMGASMGGMAAVRLGLWPGCGRAVALCGRPPNDAPRLLAQCAPAAFTPLCACLPRARRPLVFVHPDVTGPDRDWARHFARLTGGSALAVPGTGQHAILGELSKTGRLQPFLDHILDPGGPDGGAGIADFRWPAGSRGGVQSGAGPEGGRRQARRTARRFG